MQKWEQAVHKRRIMSGYYMYERNIVKPPLRIQVESKGKITISCYLTLHLLGHFKNLRLYIFKRLGFSLITCSLENNLTLPCQGKQAYYLKIQQLHSFNYTLKKWVYMHQETCIIMFTAAFTKKQKTWSHLLSSEIKMNEWESHI